MQLSKIFIISVWTQDFHLLHFYKPTPDLQQILWVSSCCWNVFQTIKFTLTHFPILHSWSQSVECLTEIKFSEDFLHIWSLRWLKIEREKQQHIMGSSMLCCLSRMRIYQQAHSVSSVMEARAREHLQNSGSSEESWGRWGGRGGQQNQSSKLRLGWSKKLLFTVGQKINRLIMVRFPTVLFKILWFLYMKRWRLELDQCLSPN